MIKTWIEKEKPLCFDCQYVQYQTTPKYYKVVKVIRNVSEREIFPKLISRDNVLDFINYAKKSNTTDMKNIILGTEFTDEYAYRIRSELNRLKLLKTFIPDLPVCDIDFDKVEIWKKYDFSDNWYIYARSDNARKKFESKGLNFDELYDDPDSE